MDFDADGPIRVERMKADGVPILLIVESSPDIRQVWVWVGRRGQVTVEEANACARLLARKYGGDPGSAKATQVGRVPGFFNRKPAYRDRGRSPLVRVRGTPNTRIAHTVIEEARADLAAPLRALRGPSVGARYVYESPNLSHFELVPVEIWCGDELIMRFTDPNIHSIETAYDDVLRYMVEHCGSLS